MTSEIDTRFPIVCIGLSAGAIQPLEVLFRHLNPETGMAFVIIHHLREHATRLPFILSNWTTMQVDLIEPGMLVQPNHIYVIPSGMELTVNDSSFRVRPRSKLRGWANVINIFMTSLSKSDHGKVAVILSGMDADGAAELTALKQQGGIVIAQAPQTATNAEMPRAAIQTGAVDYVLPPEAIAGQLEEIADLLTSKR